MRGIIIYVWAGIFLLSGFKSYAQVVDYNLVNQEDLSLYFSAISNSRSNTIKYTDMKGSPYYTDDFSIADIYFKDGKIIKHVMIRLNLYRKTLEFQKDDEILEMTGMEGLDHVKTNEELFIFMNNVEIPEDVGFYKIEIEGKYQLLQLLQVAFFDATKAASFYEDDIPAEFKKLNGKYYLGTEKNSPLAFGNKKNFQDSFAQSHISLVDYAKKNKLNPKKYDDLVKMVNYLNASNDKSTN